MEEGSEAPEVSAKVSMMRRRSQQRVHKLLNAKERTMGVDKAFLDKQCEEKAERAEAERLEELAFFAYHKQMLDIMEAREDSAFDEEAAMFGALKSDWDSQLAEHRHKVAEARRKHGVDVATCGLASAQVFAGEDEDFASRELEHDAQVQTMLKIQMEEKRAREAEERAETERYAKYEDYVSAQRFDMECDEASRRKARIQAMTEANLAEAAEVRARREREEKRTHDLEHAEIQRRLRDRELAEDTSVGRSVTSAYRYRPDHFKGFARERAQTIILENEKMLGEKAKLDAEDRALEQAYLTSQLEILTLAQDEEEAHEMNQRAAAKVLQQKILDQRDVERQRREFARKDRFGGISHGYMDGFGRSDR